MPDFRVNTKYKKQQFITYETGLARAHISLQILHRWPGAKIKSVELVDLKNRSYEGCRITVVFLHRVAEAFNAICFSREHAHSMAYIKFAGEAENIKQVEVLWQREQHSPKMI